MKKMLAVVACLCLPAVSAIGAEAKKPVLAVFDFTNHTQASWWYGGAGSDLADMLTNELASTEKFKMVERKQLGAVMSEQDLGLAGAVKPATAAKAGKMTGAQYIVTGQVSAYEEGVSGKGGGIGFKGVGVGAKKEEAYIAIDLRVVNTTSGEVAFTRSVEFRSSSKALSVGVSKSGVTGGFGKVDKTPAGKAIRGGLIEISDYLSCAMVDKGDCLAEYQAKEKARREKTKGKIKLD
jgi:curli biogenesis system outer membrane secretion channel CsgG